MSESPPFDFLEQFDPAELQDYRVDFELGPGIRCIQKMLIHNGRVVWFAIMLEVLDKGRWHVVVRSDTCHDEVHLHRFVRGRRSEIARQPLRTVRSIEDVEAGFDHACDVILDTWEENVRRWRSDGA